GMLRRLRSIVLRRRTPGVARAAERLVELGFEQALQKLTNPIAKASFDRIEPVVEKPLRCLDFRLRQVTSRGIACHGVISAGASTPESLGGPSWRLRRLHFPTTPAKATVKNRGSFVAALTGRRRDRGDGVCQGLQGMGSAGARRPDERRAQPPDPRLAPLFVRPLCERQCARDFRGGTSVPY